MFTMLNFIIFPIYLTSYLTKLHQKAEGIRTLALILLVRQPTGMELSTPPNKQSLM